MQRLSAEKAPLVSVIIPVHNCERYLAEAIESVLVQTYRSTEIIVVDDGSTDGSADVAKRFAVSRYCYQPNAGTGAARNRGIELSSGSFLAFLDADDLWVEDKLSRQMAVFDADTGVEAVFGHVKQFYSPGLGEGIKQQIRYHAEIMPGYLPTAMLIRRDTFVRVGFFENWVVGQSVSWYMRASELGLRMVMLPDVVFMRRLHETNKGITKRQFMNQRVRILKAALDRRRTMGLLGDNYPGGNK